MFKCKECDKEFPSKAALNDHLRDAKVHRDNVYERKSPYRKTVLAILVLAVIVIGVAIYAYRGTQSGAPQTSQGNSNPVWNNFRVNVPSNGAWIGATLNPENRVNYNAKGSIALETCPVPLNETMCPNIEMWIMNSTAFTSYQNGGLPNAAYGVVDISPTLGNQTQFTLNKPEINGQYYFVFIVIQQGYVLVSGTHATILISLTEFWS